MAALGGPLTAVGDGLARLRSWMGSLTGRLVATAVVLVALVSVLIGAATAAALHTYLLGRLDDTVRDSSHPAVEALGHGYSPEQLVDGVIAGPRDGRPDEEPGDLGRSSEDRLTAYVSSSYTGGTVLTADGVRSRVPTSVLAELADLRPGDADTVTIPGHGDYRVAAMPDPRSADGLLLTGLSDRSVDDTVTKLLGLESLFLLLGVAAAGGAALVLVRRQLEPLRQVAQTAHEVARLPLSTGEVGVTARVPDRLTDDTTEVGQVGAALNTLLGHVEGALGARHRSEQRVRRFVADASHELRTPLSTIHGYAELTRRAREENPEVRAKLAEQSMLKVESEATRMTALVEDLLLLARLDAGRPLERREVDLTRMALETVGDARLLAPDHRWVLDLPGDPVTTVGDERRLHQVLTNLLTNARRHPPSGTTVTVRVAGPQRRGGRALVQVHDDGPGIPEQLQGEIFERFTRGDSARTRASGGAGLGLSLAQAIVAAHGGDISVDSRPGSTTFTVALPASVPAVRG